MDVLAVLPYVVQMIVYEGLILFLEFLGSRVNIFIQNSKVKTVAYSIVIIAFLIVSLYVPSLNSQVYGLTSFVIIISHFLSPYVGLISGSIYGLVRLVITICEGESFQILISSTYIAITIMTFLLFRHLLSKSRKIPLGIVAIYTMVLDCCFFYVAYMYYDTSSNYIYAASLIINNLLIDLMLGESSLFFVAFIRYLNSKKFKLKFQKPKIYCTLEALIRHRIVAITVIFFTIMLSVIRLEQAMISIESGTESLLNDLYVVMCDMSETTSDAILTDFREGIWDWESNKASLDAVAQGYGFESITVINKDGSVIDSTDREVSYKNEDLYQLEIKVNTQDVDCHIEPLFDLDKLEATPGSKQAYVLHNGNIYIASIPEETISNYILNDYIKCISRNYNLAGQYSCTAFFTADNELYSSLGDSTNEEYWVIVDDDFMNYTKSQTPTELFYYKFKFDVFDECYEKKSAYCVYVETYGIYIVQAMAYDIIFVHYYIVFFTTLVLGSITLFLLLLVLLSSTNKLFIIPIGKIKKALHEIIHNREDIIIDVNDSVEYEELTRDINLVIKSIRNYEQKEKQGLAVSLALAKNLQLSMLPTENGKAKVIKGNDIDIFGCLYTAKEVGGDFYDYFTFPNSAKTLFILIADVSGKGIPAAMFMMRAKGENDSLMRIADDFQLSNIANHAYLYNKAVAEKNEDKMFVTAWMATFDKETGIVRYVNAGHNPPLLLHKDGKFEYLKNVSGLPLGLLEKMEYKEFEFKMSKGDILFLYTDGVTEAMNRKKELYGETRLQEFLNSNTFSNMEELCEEVKKDVYRFTEGEPQSDDITMVALKY